MDEKSEFDDLTEADARRYVGRIRGMTEDDIPRVMEGFRQYSKAKQLIGDLCDSMGVVIHLEDFLPLGEADSLTRTYSPEERRAKIAADERKRREIARQAVMEARKKIDSL